jgi:hypothetical protein
LLFGDARRLEGHAIWQSGQHEFNGAGEFAEAFDSEVEFGAAPLSHVGVVRRDAQLEIRLSLAN